MKFFFNVFDRYIGSKVSFDDFLDFKSVYGDTLRRSYFPKSQ